MTKEEILDQLREVMVEKLRLTTRPEDITQDTDLRRDFGIDSLKIVELLSELEERFGIGLDSENLSGEILVDVGKLTDFIAAETTSARAAHTGRVRPAREDDLSAVLDLQRRSFHDVAVRSGNMEISPMTQTLEELEAQFATDHVLVHEQDGIITGSVRAHVTDDRVGHVGRLIVDPAHQRRGIGSLLMAEIERALSDCVRFDIFTGAQFTEVVALYQNLGYVVTREAEHDGVPMVFMSKTSAAG